MRKKILIHTIAFSPDGVSTAYLYNDIALGLKKVGYEVVVLTTTPHYNVVESALKKQPMTKKAFGLYYESDFEGIRVLHVPQKKFKSTILRLIGFVYWHILSFILAISQKSISAILSPSPPLTIGLINIIVARLKGAKVVYNVQEIYPDFLIEQGGLKNKFVIALLKRLESFVYNQSDVVTTIDEIFYATIAPRFKDRNKLLIIPNFVDTDLYKPIEISCLQLDAHLFVPNDHLKLMYAGNIGHAQDWEPLLEAAVLLKDKPIDFYVIGEGVMKGYVQDQVKKKGLTNVYVLPYQPREHMPELLAFADLQLIFMSKEMEAHGFPSKVYTIMAAAKPLIVISGENTPIQRFLAPLDCAKLITSRNLKSKVEEIVAFLNYVPNDRLIEMGRNGYRLIESNYSSRAVVKQYLAMFEGLLR